MTHINCPDREHLASFAQGRLDESELSDLLQHVEDCQLCEQTLCDLDTLADCMISQLRAPRCCNPFSEEEAFRQRLCEVEALVGSEGLRPGRCADSEAGAHPRPQFLGEYRLLEVLGAGGMGTVYKAVHTRLEKFVAIKILCHHGPITQAAVDRFSREIKALGRLDHPHLIRAHDAGEAEHRHFLVMEFLAGSDLARVTRQLGELPIPDACEIIRQASLGLEYVHQQGLVHRDIKPSNLMLTTDGQIKILDLGLATFNQTDPQATELTSTGQIMGTIDYMAPEQGDETRGVDIRADVYSLGATLYKLLTGESPFADPNRRTLMQKLTALATLEPTPIQARRTDIPDELAAVVHRMLSRDPQHRFKSPSEVTRALQPFTNCADLHRLMMRVQGIESTRPGDAPEPAVMLPIATPTASKRTGEHIQSKIRWLTAGLAIAAILLFSIVLFWKTPAGLVRIEIHDDAIKVQFDKDGLTVTGHGTQSIHVGSRSGDIAPGSHQLTIQRGDVRMTTESFVIDRNGQTILKIEMVGETLQVLANGKQIETAGLRQFVTHPMPAAKVATALTDQLPELASEWLKMVGGLRPAQQIEEVIAELRRRNPRFDGVSRHKIDSGAVTEFRIQTDDISDISPVRALDKLKVFDCLGNYPRHGLLKDLKPLKGLLLKELNVNCTQVDDLSPLVGMPLTHLHVFYTRISDLSPLQGMPLTFLNCASTDIKDLSAVQNFPLTILSCGDTQIDDLSPLSSMKLISLNCISTRVSSFAPLKDMKLAELYFTDVPVSDLSHLIGMPLQAVKFKVKSERDGQIMRAIDTIHTINDRPASEFWKTWDAQQPSKESQRS